jgi:hypothetical protein
MNGNDEFLRSSILSNAYAEIAKVRRELLGASELDSGATQSPGGIDKCRNVINIHGLVSFRFAGTERLSKNQRIRFAGPDGAGIDAHGFGEIAKKAIRRLKMSNVNGVRVGEKPQAIGLREVLEQAVRMNGLGVQSRIPDLGKFVEIEHDA